jgi:hypothetical protein
LSLAEKLNWAAAIVVVIAVTFASWYYTKHRPQPGTLMPGIQIQAADPTAFVIQTPTDQPKTGQILICGFPVGGVSECHWEYPKTK